MNGRKNKEDTIPDDSKGKESTGNAVFTEDTCLIPGSEISPRGGNGNPFQYFLPGKSHGQMSLAGYSP